MKSIVLKVFHLTKAGIAIEIVFFLFVWNPDPIIATPGLPERGDQFPCIMIQGQCAVSNRKRMACNDGRKSDKVRQAAVWWPLSNRPPDSRYSS
jgi:hypothetical protein